MCFHGLCLLWLLERHLRYNVINKMTISQMFRDSVVVLILVNVGAIEQSFQIWTVLILTELLKKFVVLEPWENFSHHVLR